eukprot:CAMPEP_0113307924 /NCGR_PEP_ID=MMETSP0010_2-20120614/6573_1 /TAXON_ID=216773 ORGANISM="Corethron hystrix, Strain 308" /NCGR_SAMPLE_ID=MMETSP0010_2 /ASSEMBLY_ACC=CAM_ASM_000155 /LENGTH=565 /DNA_ID=CAMNT_0000162873 /DNA_START=59 /DNA_END=1753 /DNA_ORIENTATION=+ /assembly_acc=CAM_ASM_000155
MGTSLSQRSNGGSLKISLMSLGLVVVLFSSLRCVDGYLPGMTPKSFSKGEQVKLKVNSMSSIKTLLPVNYFSAPFCRPNSGIKTDHENLGEFLSGDRIINSPYVLKMNEDSYCEQTCVVDLGREENVVAKLRNERDNLSKADRNGIKLRRYIRDAYRINWLVDNLPPIAIIEGEDELDIIGSHGFPIGFKGDNSGSDHYIFNHVNIFIDYHQVDHKKNEYRVVKFVVILHSIKHEVEAGPRNEPATIKNPIESCNPDQAKRSHTDYSMAKKIGAQPASGLVLFTYDVFWQKSEVAFAHRWDVYLHQTKHDGARVHWHAIINSLLTVLTLFFVIATVLVRNLKKDFDTYNALRTEEDIEDAKEESGWKLVHGDVFRPPGGSLLLSVFVGTGVQLLLMSVLTIVGAFTGLVSLNHRGHLVMIQLFNYVLMGLASGYVSARLYKTFKGKSWQRCTILTALGFPGVFFSIFFFMDATAAFYGSSDAVPFTRILELIFFWTCLSIPLTFIGAYFGYQKDAIEFPVNTSPIPRQTPERPWYTRTWFAFIFAGVVPFSACFVELYFILLSVW